MERKNFLTQWRGRLVDARAGLQNQWAPAFGSSLNDDQRELLHNGGVIVRKKDKYYVKLFAEDEERALRSVIVSVESELSGLKESMKKVGFGEFVFA